MNRMAFFDNFRDTIKATLPREKWEAAYFAVVEFAFDGTEPEDPAIRALALAWKPSLHKFHGGARPGAGAKPGNQNAAKKNNQDNLIELSIQNNQDNQVAPEKQSSGQTETKEIKQERKPEAVIAQPPAPVQSVNEMTKFSAGRQGWQFAPELRKLAALYWQPSTIRRIETDFACQEYDTITSIGELILTYEEDILLHDPRQEAAAAAETKDSTNDIAFATFWDIYPKKRAGSKDKARRKFDAILKNKQATIRELLDGVQKYALSDEVERGFAKGCEAWLNDDRWTVDYTPPTNMNDKQRQTLLRNAEEAAKLNEWLKSND